MDDREFRRLLEFLGLSWRGYRKVRKGVKKRISRHMQELECRNMREYLEQLGGRRDEAKRQCERLMSVSISRFFRDRRLWEILERLILPELIEGSRGKLKAWSAGCASGEEVYSLKILWESMGRSGLDLPPLHITATDLNPLYLERAEQALYPLSSLKEVPEDLKEACFDPEPGGTRFRVKPFLHAGIVWLVQDFLSGPPDTGFHLVFIRNNLLTYYQGARIESALEGIMSALCPGGYVVTGSHEKIPIRSVNLEPCPSLPYVFKKKG